MVTVESSVPEPEPLFDAIGRVAFAWADLEAALGQLLVALLHTPIAGVLSVGQSYEVIRSHVTGIINLDPALEQYDPPRERLDDALRKQIRETLAEATTLAERRHQIVHGLWLPAPTSPGWVTLRPRRHKPLMPQVHFTIEDMHNAARDIGAVSRRFRFLGSTIDPRIYGLLRPPAQESEISL
jgi:hypothetical protein